MADERILIIDSSAENTAALVDDILHPAGYQTLSAADLQAGRCLAQAEQPEAILVALDLIEQAGPEQLDALKSGADDASIVVIGETGSELLVVEALRQGAGAYLQRPFDPAEVRRTLDGVLAKTRLRKERDELARQLHASREKERQYLRELNTLFGAGKSVTTLWDQDKLLSRLVEAAIFLTNAEEGSLLLVDESSGELYMVAAQGIDEHTARSFRLPVDDSLAGQVLTSGQPLLLSSQALTKIKTAYLVRALIYVPLKLKNRVMGVLAVDNRQRARDFTNHDLRLLSSLADFAAITLENIRLLDQVEQEQNKLAAVLAAVESPLLILSGEDNRVIAANASFNYVFGRADRPLADQPLANQPLADLVDEPALLEFVAAAAQAPHGYQSEIVLTSGRTFRAISTPIPEIGRAITLAEVTHFKALDKQKSKFISAISRELHTPLTSIRDYVKMLDKAGELNEKQSLFVERIADGVIQLTALVDELLDLDRVQLEIDPNETTVDLDRLVARVVAEFQPQANRHQQQLIYHQPAEAALVYGSPARLEQVISHLIENALTYTPAAGQVATFVQVQGDRVIWKIEDNGPGIPAGDLPFIFGKFFRSQADSVKKHNGAGLGLAVCKTIIEKYEGQIWVDSQPGQGSVFTVVLPRVSDGTASSPLQNMETSALPGK